MKRKDIELDCKKKPGNIHRFLVNQLLLSIDTFNAIFGKLSVYS